MASQQYALGIDIGTTSVKVCVFNPKTNELVSKQSKDTQANVPSDQGAEGNKQDVPKIISAMHSCMSRLPKEVLRHVNVIGVCGQMHGVTLWNHTLEAPVWERIESGSSVKFEVCRQRISNLYTWQDSRCDAAFLSTLPQPECHIQPSTGHGCCTMFWFAKNRPEKLQKYNCAGTVQDFAVALLCNLEKPVMSTQNAASWGYFNTTSACWSKDVLENSGFPVCLLPQVVKPKSVAGYLPECWFGIPQGTPVGAAFGDFQCSVIATLNASNEAALNISTSAQLAFKMGDGFEPESVPSGGRIDYIPYFNDSYLAVAAALNGGNALATFVQMLQQWTLQLGFSVPQAKVWEKLLELGQKEDSESGLQITPTLLGERHAPEQNAAVVNVDPGNLALGKVFRALCKGVIQNLSNMVPSSTLKEHNIERIVGSGSALIRNPILQSVVQETYSQPVEFVAGRGACLGAALAMASATPSAARLATPVKNTTVA